MKVKNDRTSVISGSTTGCQGSNPWRGFPSLRPRLRPERDLTSTPGSRGSAPAESPIFDVACLLRASVSGGISNPPGGRTVGMYPTHTLSPAQIPRQILPLSPRKTPEAEEIDLGGGDAPIGFDAPAEIGTPPRPQAVTARELPQKAKHAANLHRQQGLCYLKVEEALGAGSPWSGVA